MQAFGDYTVVAHHEFPECSLRLLRMAQGEQIPSHHHTACTQSYLAMEGSVEVRVGDVFHRIEVGEAVRVPAGQVHAVRPLAGAALVLSVSIPPLRAGDHFPDPAAGERREASWE